MVDIATYRRRIGTHALRVYSAGRSAGNRSPGMQRGFSNDFRDFEFSLVDYPDSTSFQPSSVCKLSRARARAGLFATVMYVALWMMAMLQDSRSCKNIHDLSSLILNAGDIEENPGPGSTAGSETTATEVSSDENMHVPTEMELMEAKWARQFKDLEQRLQGKCDYLEEQLTKQNEALEQMAVCCDRDVNDLVQGQLKNQSDIAFLSERLNDVVDEVQNNSLQNEDQADKTEGMFIRNNVKMYGVYEGENESYFDCVQTVLNLLREALPTIPWSEKDIIRVQRLGPARGNSQYKPRPLIVQLNTLLDKLTLLRFGREVLRLRGIQISSEITRRQARTLSDLREQGHEAFFRNNRLWFRDSRPRQRPNHRPQSFKPQRHGKQGRRPARNDRYTSDWQSEPRNTYQSSPPQFHQEMQQEYWAHPNYGRQDHDSTVGRQPLQADTRPVGEGHVRAETPTDAGDGRPSYPVGRGDDEDGQYRSAVSSSGRRRRTAHGQPEEASCSWHGVPTTRSHEEEGSKSPWKRTQRHRQRGQLPAEGGTDGFVPNGGADSANEAHDEETEDTATNGFLEAHDEIQAPTVSKSKAPKKVQTSISRWLTRNPGSAQDNNQDVLGPSAPVWDGRLRSSSVPANGNRGRNSSF